MPSDFYTAPGRPAPQPDDGRGLSTRPVETFIISTGRNLSTQKIQHPHAFLTPQAPCRTAGYPSAAGNAGPAQRDAAGPAFQRPPEGLPPAAFRRLRGSHPLMERAMGIEPTWPAWKAGALPLSYARWTKSKVQSPKSKVSASRRSLWTCNFEL